ncbi:MAG: hypothetical protein QXP29_05595 [Candidatus Nezhaarchaeales archaeon]
MSEMYRTVVFGRKRIGKARRRYVDCIKIYLSMPVKKSKPFFEARIDRDSTKMALESFKAKYDDRGDFLILHGDDVDEALRKLIVYCGVRQTVNSLLGAEVLEIVNCMGEVELLFWYSRFINAYDRGSYWDVYRVAKAFRTLYRV